MPDTELEKGKKCIQEALKKVAYEEHIQIKKTYWESINPNPENGQELRTIERWKLTAIAYKESSGQKKLTIRFPEEHLEDCPNHKKFESEIQTRLRKELIKSFPQKKIGFLTL